MLPDNCKQIDEALQAKDLTLLRQQCVHGFGTNSQRRAAWRFILDIPEYNPTIAPLFNHRDYRQVVLDVNRSFCMIKVPEFRNEKRKRLLRVLMTVLERNPDLDYYQGFHDIASLVITFARDPLAVLILEAIAHGPLSPCLCKDITGVSSILNFLFPLLKLTDEELHNFLCENDSEANFLASYVMTYFLHYVDSFEEGLRYLDFFISSHPLIPVYSLVAVLKSKREILTAPGSDAGTLMQHFNDLLSGTNVGKVIQDSVDLFYKFPPTFVLLGDKNIKLSSKCCWLNPKFSFSFQYPDFPLLDRFPKHLYRAHLDDSPPKKPFSRNLISERFTPKPNIKTLSGLISALAIAAVTFGAKIMF